MEWLRQLRELTRLQWRFWARRGLVRQQGTADRARTPGLVLRAVFLLVFGNMGRTTGVAVHGQPHAVAWMFLGLVAYAASSGFLTSLGTVRGMATPLQAVMLEALPLRLGPTVVLRIASAPHLFAMAVVAIHVASPAPDLARDVAMASLVVTSASLVGIAAAHAVRAVVSPILFARALVPAFAVFVGSFFTFLEAVILPKAAWLDAIGARAWPVTASVVGAASPWGAVARFVLAGVLASVALSLAERRGYDHVAAVATKRYERAATGDLSLARIDRLLTRREPGAAGTWVAVIYVSLLTGGAVVATYVWGSVLSRAAAADDKVVHPVVGTLVAVTAFMAFSQGAARAGRAVERDLVARPLLAPLSVTPADLLAGKVRALRRSALLVGVPLVLLPFANLDASDRITIALRVAATLAGLWVATDALVSVSFLTSGIGAGPRAASGTGIGLDRLLVLVPTLSIATAPSTWAALVALGSLALLAAEARRSALLCVRWIDDDEDFARETPVWRALLVFAAFSAVQGLTAGLTALTSLSPLTAMAVVYLVAAVALVALTARERSLATIALWPERASWLGVGALVGAGVAAFAVAYQTWAAPHLGVTFEPLDAGSILPFSVMAIAAAPVAEELFFRGWLQDAILRDHAGRGPAFGIAVTAFAFASIHPPGNFAAPLVLGLATGWLALRSRSIGPGIVAHAMMNAAAILARAYLG